MSRPTIRMPYKNESETAVLIQESGHCSQNRGFLHIKIAFAKTPTEIPQKHRLECHKSADLILSVIDCFVSLQRFKL